MGWELAFNHILITTLGVIVAISIFSVAYTLGNLSEDKNLQTSSLGTNPTSTVIVPQEKLIGPKTLVVSSVTSNAKYTTTNVNYLYANGQFLLPWIKDAFAVSSGQITVTSTEWTIPTVSSAPYGISNDASGNVYFAESSGNKVGRLVPSTNVITEWTVPTVSSSPFGISNDASGNVYFAENGGNKVGRLS